MSNITQYINIERADRSDDRCLCIIQIYYNKKHPHIILRNLGIIKDDTTSTSLMSNLFRYVYLKFLRDAPDDTYRFTLERASETSIYERHEIPFYIRKTNGRYDFINAFNDELLCSYGIKETILYEFTTVGNESK